MTTIRTTHLADAATHVCLDCGWRDAHPEHGNETAHVMAFPRHRVMVSLIKLAVVYDDTVMVKEERGTKP